MFPQTDSELAIAALIEGRDFVDSEGTLFKYRYNEVEHYAYYTIYPFLHELYKQPVHCHRLRIVPDGQEIFQDQHVAVPFVLDYYRDRGLGILEIVRAP